MRKFISALGVVMAMTWISLHGAIGQTFDASNLPILIIDTYGEEILDEPKTGADLKIIDNGGSATNHLTDPPVFESRIGIEIRGSSSQMFPKKQYGVELWDEEDDGYDASLLGFPEEEDWIFFAPYNDKTLMRDVLAYKLGRDMGRYAPRTKYCEVVLNGEYNGVYVLIEKIKRDKNRLDINKLNPDEISGNDLTGGYIFKIDKTSGDSGPGWVSPYPPPGRSGGQVIHFQYEDPKHDEIVPEQKQYIQQYVRQFEDALRSDDFTDPESGYAAYIDVPSFVDYFLINELTKNVDAYRLSTFMHKQRDSDGGKLFMGPIWDYNLGFGNVDYCTNGDPEGFVMRYNNICPEDYWLVPFWWSRLFEDPAFRDQVTTRWQELRGGAFKTETIHARIDSMADLLSQGARQRNFERWPVLGTYVWPNYFVGATFEREVKWLKDWIADRTAWLDINIPHLVTTADGPRHVQVSVFPNPSRDRFRFQFDVTTPGEARLELSDATGHGLITRRETSPGPGLVSWTVGEALPPGLYFYRIFVRDVPVGAGKIMKQ